MCIWCVVQNMYIKCDTVCVFIVYRNSIVTAVATEDEVVVVFSLSF